MHPRSGAGSIKDDCSTDTIQMEVKDAAKSHTIKGSALETLFVRAAKLGKEAEYIIYFADNDITLTGKLTRGKG